MNKESILLIGRGETLQYYIQGMINNFSTAYQVIVMDKEDLKYEGEHIRLTFDDYLSLNTKEDIFWSKIKEIEIELKLNLFDSYSNYFYYGRLAEEGNIKHSGYWKSKDEIAIQYHTAYLNYKKIFQKYNIKFIYHDTIDLVHTQVLEAFSKKYNIGFYHTFIIPGIFNNRVILGTGIKRLNYLFYKSMNDKIKPTNEEKLEISNILKKFRNSKPTMSYLKEVSQQVITFNEVKRIFSRLSNVNYAYKRVMNRIWLKKSSQYFDIKKCGKYILYYMSHQPEATTTSVAQDFVDQWKIVEEIAVHAPSDISIVIKPHPFGYGWHGKKYYEKLLRLPNVYLAPIEYNGKELIENATAVVTINGSVALESVIYRTPAYVLDKVWYSYPGYIERIDHPKDILKKLDNLNVLSEDKIENLLLSAYRSSAEFFISYSLGNKEFKIKAGKNLSSHILENSDIYFNREIESYEPKV